MRQLRANNSGDTTPENYGGTNHRRRHLFRRARLAERTTFQKRNHRVKLTDNLVDLAVTDAGSAGKSAENRGLDVEASRANGATGRRREGRTGCPGEGGNAAAAREFVRKKLASISIGLNWRIIRSTNSDIRKKLTS
jgi:hypothetical protein